MLLFFNFPLLDPEFAVVDHNQYQEELKNIAQNKNKKNTELVQIYLYNFNKITIINNFLAFFCCYFSIFPSWIRKMNADQDPQPWL